MKKIDIGIVGLGHQGIIHTSNALRLKKYCNIVGIADVSRSALSKVDKVGIKTYTDYKEMLNKEKMDAVIVSLPNYLHEECCIFASETDCDIFVEKPLARNIDEAKRIADYIKRSDKYLMIGMCQRFMKDIQRLKDIVDNGTLGHIEHANVVFCASPFWSGSKVQDWWFDITKTGGGVLIDNGYHIIDLLLWLFGDVKYVSGYLEHNFNLEQDDYAEISLRFKNGTNATASMSWRTRIPVFDFTIVGQWGKSSFIDSTNPFEGSILKAGFSFMSNNIIQRIKGRSFLPLGGDQYYNELEYFMKCIINDEEPRPNADDAIKVLEIVDSIYRNQK